MSNKAADPRYMKDYLRFAVQFEKNYYIWEHALQQVNASMRQLYERRNADQTSVQNLQHRCNTIDQPVRRSSLQDSGNDKAKRYQSFSKIALKVVISVIIISAVFGILMAAAFAKDAEGAHRLVGVPVVALSVVIGAMIVCPVGLPAYAFFRAKARSAVVPVHSAEYEERSRQREKAQLVNTLYQTQHSLQESYEKERALSARQEEIAAAFRTAKSNRENLYAENVLPQKYRNWNAIATMYEYLATGRCTTIQGHGGIYDTYENDVKQGLIISNLQGINARLDVISENQQMLYREFSQANRTLSSIQNSLTNIEKYSAQTAQNTAISAAADRQIAESARWIEWRMWANGYYCSPNKFLNLGCISGKGCVKERSNMIRSGRQVGQTSLDVGF
ncbi:MAG: hypothetical protein IKI58_06265 [Oscillospiraceae bacterium]|nr:hypothetical protein [Oscillospiraceae bacterium]